MKVSLKPVITIGCQLYKSALDGLQKLSSAVSSATKNIFHFIANAFSRLSNGSNYKTSQYMAFGFGAGFIAGVAGLSSNTPVFSLLFSKTS